MVDFDRSDGDSQMMSRTIHCDEKRRRQVRRTVKKTQHWTNTEETHEDGSIDTASPPARDASRAQCLEKKRETDVDCICSRYS